MLKTKGFLLLFSLEGKMGLFGKTKEEKERKELKGQIDKLMNSYSKEEIDRETYLKKMMDLSAFHQDKKKK